jgi:predicted Zn-dependent protease with MMP-like domain
MDIDKFEKLVEEALDDIPRQFKKYLENIVLQIEEYPSRETLYKTNSSPYSTLLGLYHGVPFKHRGPFYGNIPPDVIVIYKRPIEKICSTEKDIKKKIKEVVFHEIGHYFGLSEKELRLIEES